MTQNDIQNLIATRQSLKAQLDLLVDQLAALDNNIKAEMTAQGTDTIETAEYKVKWTTYKTHRFDQTAFKAVHSELFKAFTKETEAKRFTVSLKTGSEGE